MVVVVVPGKLKCRRGRNQPAHPADGRDQLRHRVLGRDRVVQQRGVQRPTLPTRQHPGRGDHLADRIEDPLGPLRGPQPVAPQHQDRRMEAWRRQRQAARHLPGDVAGQLPARLPVRQPLQGLQHHHRGHHVGRHRRAAPAGGEQVSKQLVGKQPGAVVGQEGVHRAVRDQMPAQRRSIQQLYTGGVARPLHVASLTDPPLQGELLSSLLAAGQADVAGDLLGMAKDRQASLGHPEQLLLGHGVSFLVGDPECQPSPSVPDHDRRRRRSERPSRRSRS
jgi:hypothetical protein